MTLLELCDPLFQYMCRFNRSARKHVAMELSSVRADIKAMLADMRARANAIASSPGAAGYNPVLPSQFEKIELVLMFFVDFTIKSAGLPNAAEWQELAFERKELAGDERFFELLDETLADRAEAANERLLIFYTCMGLGFTGWYTGQPEYLRKKMMECAGRVRNFILVDQQSRICPEAYENVNTANLIEPPASSLVGIMIVLIGMAIVLIGAYVYYYKSASDGLLAILNAIISKGAGVK
ncbi:MAG: DotU family type IV/VI secretion system protein [Tepidisphaeraceae bacterium]|jgi:type VI protein secretion system component VasF